jgi:ABC-type uncharacterized transport system substrate-binding protein
MTSRSGLTSAFAELIRQRPDALIVGADPTFTERYDEIAKFANTQRMPAIYTQREYVDAGGLMSWGVSLTEQYRVAGNLVGRILTGEKPSDLPVWQPTKFDLVINLRAAKTLGIAIPDRLITLANDVSRRSPRAQVSQAALKASTPGISACAT